MKRILVDSGPLIALFDQSDKYHLKSIEFIKNNTSELLTTLASITETLHLLDFNRHAQFDFLTWINKGAIKIEPIETADLIRIKELMMKYADLPMDFADACLVLLGEKYKISVIATIDRDFEVYRMNGHTTFKVILK
ncbi:MAG: PIN domain-containing protein [Methylococcaceae bacterium]|nr:PIN domain-containing protein [Methylococcaceae bacterium]